MNYSNSIWSRSLVTTMASKVWTLSSWRIKVSREYASTFIKAMCSVFSGRIDIKDVAVPLNRNSIHACTKILSPRREIPWWPRRSRKSAPSASISFSPRRRGIESVPAPLIIRRCLVEDAALLSTKPYLFFGTNIAVGPGWRRWTAEALNLREPSHVWRRRELTGSYLRVPRFLS